MSAGYFLMTMTFVESDNSQFCLPQALKFIPSPLCNRNSDPFGYHVWANCQNRNFDFVFRQNAGTLRSSPVLGIDFFGRLRRSSLPSPPRSQNLKISGLLSWATSKSENIAFRSRMSPPPDLFYRQKKCRVRHFPVWEKFDKKSVEFRILKNSTLLFVEFEIVKEIFEEML